MIFKLPRKFKKRVKKMPSWITTKEWLEWYLFPKRIDVRVMEICITYPKWDKEKHQYEFDPKLFKPATNEQLLEWYKKYCSDDKLAHHFCKQNRHKLDKFNNHEIRR